MRDRILAAQPELDRQISKNLSRPPRKNIPLSSSGCFAARYGNRLSLRAWRSGHLK
jgi:hypothetical protein